jgi:hypothetical protein
MVKGVAEEGKRVMQGRNRGVAESGVTESCGKGSWRVVVKGDAEEGKGSTAGEKWGSCGVRGAGELW